MKYLRLLSLWLLLLFISTSCSLSKAKKAYLESTDSLLQVVEVSSARLHSFPLTKIDSIVNCYKDYELHISQQEVQNDTLIYHFRNLTQQFAQLTSEYKNIESQIAFSLEDLDKLKHTIKNPETTEAFIDQYLYYAGTAVEAIDIRSKQIENMLSNQMHIYKMIHPYIESELANVSK